MECTNPAREPLSPLPKTQTRTTPARVRLSRNDGSRVANVYATSPLATLADFRKLMVAQLGEHGESLTFVVDGAPITEAQEQFEPFELGHDVTVLKAETNDVGEMNHKTEKSKVRGWPDSPDQSRPRRERSRSRSHSRKRSRAQAEKSDKKQKEKSEKKAKEDAASVGEQAGHFRVNRKQVKQVDCSGRPTGETEEVVEVTIVGAALKEALRRITQLSLFYEAEPTITAVALLPHIATIKEGTSSLPPPTRPGLSALACFLDAEFAATKAKVEAMLEKGVVSFDALWFLFPKSTKFVATVDECMIGSIVDEAHYSRSFFSNDFVVSAQLVRTNGRSITMVKRNFSIGSFRGTIPISDLALRPITDAEQAKLTARGRVFREHALGCHYLSYSGPGFRKSWFCTTRFKADGRVVVDGANFARFNPNYDMGMSNRRGDESSALGDAGIEDAMLWRCWHSLHGFSLSAKKWLELRVNPVKFDDDAFGRLVLSEERKGLVRALVTQGGSTAGSNFNDIISGKGGGCIFLLHGTPGTGKTLTAEAIAELLHRPLYSVGVGELGVSCSELEEKLREILEVASAWDAVVLIDEADIFLERRSENDIHRNAMVGVFLRLLEYHQGVLFLTTNRVRSFDDAFHSRISVALRYEALGKPARAEVWANLLGAAGIGELDPSALADYELNGRQIKNTIRLAQSLAASEGVGVSAEHVARTVGVTAQFQKEMQGPEC